MITHIRSPLFNGLTVTLTLLIALASTPSGAAPATQSAQPIFEYEVIHEMLVTVDRQRIEVYEDGRVRIHFPAYMKRAGDYLLQLSDNELQTLTERLSSPNVQLFDPHLVTAEMEVAQVAKRTVTAISDASYSNFEFIPSVSPGNAGGLSDVYGAWKIRWANLQHDARSNPKIKSLRELADIEQSLQDMTNHRDLERIQ